MNDTALKNFAVSARKQLIEEVGVQMARWAIDEQGSVPATADIVHGRVLSAEQRSQRAALLALCRKLGAEHLGEQAAYTWFNRMLAIRFMELHDYLPCRMRFFSAEDGSFDPQVLKFALEADIEGVDHTRVAELVQASDGNAQLFRYLFLAQCNELAASMPTVFERIGSATELLLPENLLNVGSVIERMVTEIPEDDWREGVEIVGWMYQYYVSERKDEVFANFKKGKKAEAADIAPATQLFTPHWIVRYLTENSLGRLWLENHPESQLAEQMDFFIPDSLGQEALDDESASDEGNVSGDASAPSWYPERSEAQPSAAEGSPEHNSVPILSIPSPEALTVCDPACGSGHILVFTFDLLAAIYEERGYTRRQIPSLILEQNLTGFEIDPRAAAMASFALTMKACELDSRFLSRDVQPNIRVLQSIEFTEEELADVPDFAGNKQLIDTLAHLSECGSLWQPTEEDAACLRTALEQLEQGHSLFSDKATEKLRLALDVCTQLMSKFVVVVANPPYMGSSSMGKWLANYMKKHFSDSKRDLCTCFIERGLSMCGTSGFASLVTMQSWMFLGSFESLREKLLKSNSIISMAHIGARGFDSIGGEVVSTTATVFRAGVSGVEGSYIRLVDLVGEQAKADATLEAISNPTCGWFYRRNAETFKSIPGTPIAYWASAAVLKAFQDGLSLAAFGKPRQGMATGDNAQFVREWWEVSQTRTKVDAISSQDALVSGAKWFPYNKGGEYRKWYGNDEYVVDWLRDGENIKRFSGSVIRNSQLYFSPAITWSKISSAIISFRFKPHGHIFDVAGTSIFADEGILSYIQGLCNSSCIAKIAGILSPTLNFEVGQIASYPVIESSRDARLIIGLVMNSREISKQDWNDCETSWDFSRCRLV